MKLLDEEKCDVRGIRGRLNGHGMTRARFSRCKDGRREEEKLKGNRPAGEVCGYGSVAGVMKECGAECDVRRSAMGTKMKEVGVRLINWNVRKVRKLASAWSVMFV